MIKEHSRIWLLETPIDILKPENGLEQFKKLIFSNSNHQIITTNSLMIMEAQQNPELRDAYKNASFVIPDSSGVVWAVNRYSQYQAYRWTGIDLALQLCGLMEKNNLSIGLLGAKPEVMEKAKTNLLMLFPKLKINFSHHGYFNQAEETELLSNIKKSGIKLLLVAMGMPKQEIWIHQNLMRLNSGITIGVGGSFDVWAGVVKRAPIFFQKTGIEWIFRLIQEPSRWRRMTKLPQFAGTILKQREKSVKNDHSKEVSSLPN